MKTPIPVRHQAGRTLAVIAVMAMAGTAARADYQSTVLNDQPLAYFALDLTVDNAGTATDLSGNGNNSTYYNIYPVAGPTAYIPNAANFAGASLLSYVDLGSGPNTGILNFGGPITMEAWVQSTNTTQGPADILGKGYDSSQNYDELVLRAQSSGGKYSYYGGTYNGSNGGASASGGQQTTNWTYLVATYDGTNWNMYVNAQLVGTGADTVGALNFSDPWAIGTGSADGASRFFQGNLCQVALYGNALTPGQVMTHFFAGELNADPGVSAPIIVSQPQGQQSYVGGSVTFSVNAVSALTTTQQWYYGSTLLNGKTNATLTLGNLKLSDAGNYSVVVGNANGSTNSAPAVLSVNTPNSLQWSANNNSGVWDTTNSANWLNLSNNNQTVFNPGDEVLFDDTAGVPTTVGVSGNVAPSLITVNSTNNSYTLNGSGLITGSGSLVKAGPSALTITSAGNFTGSASIEGGLIYAGNNCFSGVSSVLITNNSTLDFGGGTLNNSRPVTVSGSGVNGEGALYNSYSDYPGESMNITLAGDTTFGGSARWDLAAGSQINGPFNLTLDWSADSGGPYGEWNTVVVGPNVAGITLTNGSHLGAKSMDTGFQNPDTMFTLQTNCQLIFWTGGWNGSLHLEGGAIAYLWTAPAAFNGSRIVLDENAQWQSYYNSGDEPINSAVTLNGVAHIVVGDHNMIYTNVISGPGGFVWDAYNHAMILEASNTYSGPSIIDNGLTVSLTGDGSISHSSLIFFGGSNPNGMEIDVSSRNDQTLTLASGQTLAGIGGVNGNLVVSPGATISPAGTNVTIGITNGANPTGTLTISGSVTLSGTTVIKLDGTGVSDNISATGPVTAGGTLSLVNLTGAPMSVGDSFQIFSSAGVSGSFATVTPATPGPGLAWDFSQLNAGTLNVIAGSGGSGPVVSNPAVSGGNLTFSGSGGTPGGTYYVIASTNLTTPLVDWTVVSTNIYDGSGNFLVTNPITAGAPNMYYRIKQ